ncbi:MAG: ArnT family glycosyltransferase [Flavisolibacter sp.]
MNKIKRLFPAPVLLFTIGWLIINLLQAAFTELTSDEGYYWFYSTKLDWGYYDHPPMVALMIRLGTYLFHGTLGVRFMNVLLSTGSMLLFFSLLDVPRKEHRRTFLVLLSIPLITYLAFIVFPDGPLIFFCLLFLVLYKRFLERNSVSLAILIGITISLMLYSKYHGLLVILFVFLSNPSLIKNRLSYLAISVAILLFIPHIIWQYHHHFITLGYHLSGRTDPLTLRHIPEYISQQIPAIGIGVFFTPFIVRTKDLFERALKFIVVGTFIFFLFSSLKTFVHFHWTSIAIFPIAYFAIQYYYNPEKGRLFNFLIWPFVILIVIVRLQLMTSILPFSHANVDYYKGRDLWAQDISRLAGNIPVLFPYNLRECSLYSFYSGRLGVTFYGREEKKSQYDLWNYEDSLQGKDVFFVAQYPYPGGKELQTRMGETVYYTTIRSFRSYYDQLPINATAKIINDSVLKVNLIVTNQRKNIISFEKNSSGQPPVLIYSLEKNNEPVQSDTLKVLSVEDALDHLQERSYEFIVPIKDVKPGNYTILFGFKVGILPEAFNSPVLQLSIPEKKRT